MSAETLLAPPEAHIPMDGAGFAAATGATAAQMADLEAYRALLAEWNQRMNLVGPSALANFWDRHAFDSAQLLDLAPEGSKTWADLGAGAGLPGLILAILLKDTPGACVHLIESMAKRCTFLRTVVAALNLPAEVHNERAESLDMTVDIVTARACAPMNRLLMFAAPYLRRGAVGLFLKGQDVETELADSPKARSYKVRLEPSRSNPAGRIVKIEGGPRARR